jgi:site-specific recombinase XerD
VNIKPITLMDEYTRYLKALGRSEKTISWYLFILERFFQFLEGIQEIKDISSAGRKELTVYISHLRESDKWPGKKNIKGDHGKLSPYSIRGYVVAIKAFWNWLLHEGFIDKNPLAGYPLPEVPENIIKVIEPKRFEKLLSLIARSDPVGDKYYCLFLLLFDTGARISEAVGIELNDFLEMKEFITVVGKRKIERRVPILPETRRQINRYISRSRPLLTQVDSIYLFPKADGNHVTVNSVQQYLRRLLKKSGLNDIRIYCHLLRHSFATHTINNGANIVHVKEIMGHKSIATTLKYTHLKPADLQREHARYSPVRDLNLTR